MAFAPYETVTETYDSASGRLNHKETSVNDLALIVTAGVLFGVVTAFAACFYVGTSSRSRGETGADIV